MGADGRGGGQVPPAVALLATQAVAGVWHGINPGQLAFFVMTVPLIINGRTLYRIQASTPARPPPTSALCALCALRSLRFALSALCALRSALSALCTLRSALCALCALRFALCALCALRALRSLRSVIRALRRRRWRRHRLPAGSPSPGPTDAQLGAFRPAEAAAGGTVGAVGRPAHGLQRDVHQLQCAP